MKRFVFAVVLTTALVLATLAAAVPGGVIREDLSRDTVGAEPTGFVPAVGVWYVAVDGNTKVLVVDGRRWRSGQTAAGLAEKARTLYGERYAEFLDNVSAFAYYPYAVAKDVDDFREGEISVRFKPLEGRVDQAAGILFNLKPTGDYLTMRANALEDNLVLWRLSRGKRASLKWIRNTPTPSRQWHDLTLRVKGRTVEGYLDGKRVLEHTLAEPVSGKVGVWSKADSVVYFTDFSVKPAG